MDAKKPPLSCYADLSSCTSINRRLSSVQRHFAFLIGRHLSPLFFFRTKFRLKLVDEKRHSKKTFDTRKRLGPRPRSPLDRSRDSCEGRLLRKGLLVGPSLGRFLRVFDRSRNSSSARMNVTLHGFMVHSTPSKILSRGKGSF